MSKRKGTKKLFQSPISLNLTNEDGQLNLDCLVFDGNGYVRCIDKIWDPIRSFIGQNKEKTIWLNLYPIENKKIIEQVEDHFTINPFIMSDAVDFTLRPKSWYTETNFFCSFKMVKPGYDDTEHISFILGNNYIISLQEVEADLFQHIRDRIINNYGLIRKKGVDYLFFLLCDAVVDQYTLVADKSEDHLLAIEEKMSLDEHRITLKELHESRKNVSGMLKDVRAASDVLESIAASDFFVITPFVQKLFSSIIHNSRYSIDSFSRQLEHTSNLSDLYFAQQNQKLNEMIRLLTIMSAFFIPLTFIAGLYGMNFRYMPELNYTWAYPAILGIMLVVVLVIFMVFKRKKWF
jgi:magnesium transporter